MSKSHVARLFLLLGISFLYSAGGLPEDCPGPPPTRRYANPVVYKYHARNVEGRAEQTQRLVGVFPIHDADCTKVVTVKNYNGFQRAEAMVFALNVVNAQVREGKKKVALDAYLVDSCSNGISAIDATLVAMREVAWPVAGLVGGSYSSVSIAVSSVLQSYNVSMLSYASTATQLSDKQSHPLFGRLVPSDDAQAQVVYDLALELGWSTVEVVSVAASDYSKSLKKKFVQMADDKKDIFVCQQNNNELRQGDEEGAMEIVAKLLSSRVDGVVVFVNANSKRLIVSALDKLLRDLSTRGEILPSLSLIATDSWDVGDLGNEFVATFLRGNSYVVIPETGGRPGMHQGRDIEDHLRELNPLNSSNPWIGDVWESMCSVKNDSDCAKSALDLNDFQIDTKVDFVVDAVVMFSEALEKCHEDRCSVNTDRFFWNYLMKAKVEDSGRQVEFNCSGDILGRYGIYRMEDIGERGSRYEKIGSWDERRGGQKLRFLQTRIDLPEVKPKKNVTDGCRPICQVGQYENFDDKRSKCCYSCDDLGERSYLPSLGNPQVCPPGQWPDRKSNFSDCFILPVKTLNPHDPWAAFSLATAWVGIILGSSVLAFSVVHRDHVVIKNSSRELSSFTWVGVMICHLNTLFVFYASPSSGLCALIRFTMTIGYTFILASLYLKTNRLFRIFYSQFKQTSGILGRPKYTSPRDQVLLCLSLVSIQVLVICCWIYIAVPKKFSVYPAERHILVCEFSPLHLLYAQAFNMVLCVVTTAYSFLTRRLPEDFNESRFINLSMYSLCVAWVVEAISWIFREDLEDEESQLRYYPERSWAISTSAKSIMATLVMAFLSTPRIYKILWEPHKNKRDDDTPQIFQMSNNGVNSVAPPSAAITEENQE